MAISAREKTEMEQWETEDDLRTLIRAKEIGKDSKRMAKVRKLAKQKAAEMDSISQKQS